ncbi:MAG: DUF6482 family protein [Cellvibrionaceae bacterium]|nr:DUF6482 family protein [Cellvibrionaceae bacterium]
MKKISLSQLCAYKGEVKLKVVSLESCLYQAFVMLEDQLDMVLCDNKGDNLKAASIGLLAQKLQGLEPSSAVLIQSSPYDEMIGHEPQEKVAPLEVKLDWEELSKNTRH